MDDGNACQHHRVDNETWKCAACGDQMISQNVEARTVKSAPNLAPGSGVYVPDHRNTRTVVVGHNVTYECDRCASDGWIAAGQPISWPCGKVHRGEG